MAYEDTVCVVCYRNAGQHVCVWLSLLCLTHLSLRASGKTVYPNNVYSSLRENCPEAALLNPSTTKAEQDFLGTSPMNEPPTALKALFFLSEGLVTLSVDWLHYSLSYRVYI